MKKYGLAYLILLLKIMAFNVSDINDNPNWNDECLEVTNLSLEVTNDTLLDSAVYETVLERVASPIDMYFTPILIVLGISGNMLSVYVFFSSKLRHQSTSQYLSALAITDSVFLAQLLPPWLSTMGFNGVFHQNPFCKAFVYVSYVSCSLSSWLVIAFTGERFVAVQHPLRRHSVCTVRRARYIILGLAMGAMLINLPVLHFAGSDHQMCQIDREKLDQAAKFNWVDTTVTFTIPLILIIFFNTWIAAILYKLERDRLRLTQEKLRTISMGQQKLRDNDFIHPSSQRRITNMLLIVSTTFVLFNCPAYTLRVCGYAYDMDSSDLDDKWLVAQNLATTLFNANFGINFFLYCFTGQNFRRALVETVPCFRWIARRANALLNRSTANNARACSVDNLDVSSASAASTQTNPPYMETSFARPNTLRSHRRSGNYIMSMPVDNRRQRRAHAMNDTSDSICMHEITSRAGPSRDVVDDQPRPGTSQTCRSVQTCVAIEPMAPDVESRRTAFDPRRPNIESRCSVVDMGPRRLAVQWRRSDADSRRPTFEPRRPTTESMRSAVHTRRSVAEPRQTGTEPRRAGVESRRAVTDLRHSAVELNRPVSTRFTVIDARRPCI